MESFLDTAGCGICVLQRNTGAVTEAKQKRYVRVPFTPGHQGELHLAACSAGVQRANALLGTENRLTFPNMRPVGLLGLQPLNWDRGSEGEPQTVKCKNLYIPPFSYKEPGDFHPSPTWLPTALVGLGLH